jgi:hypothetical protein
MHKEGSFTSFIGYLWYNNINVTGAFMQKELIKPM